MFFCESLGLAVEEDEAGMVVVAGWKEDSPAAEHPSLMVGIYGWHRSRAKSLREGVHFRAQSLYLSLTGLSNHCN